MAEQQQEEVGKRAARHERICVSKLLKYRKKIEVNLMISGNNLGVLWYCKLVLKLIRWYKKKWPLLLSWLSRNSDGPLVILMEK